MDGFGEDLRREREQRGLTLETISERTKFQVRYLQAVEGERYEELPGGVFRRGIVRGYVGVLELDESEWLSRFSSSYAHHASAVADALAPDWMEFATNVRRGRLQGRNLLGEGFRLRWFGVALMLVALAALADWVWSTVFGHR